MYNYANLHNHSKQDTYKVESPHIVENNTLN